MNAGELKARVLPGLLSGARNGLAAGVAGAMDSLQALSLAGQALRFERPPRPGQFHVDEPVDDARTIIPDGARPMVLRLMNGKGQAQGTALLSLELARALSERRLRLHPFDLPKLESFVRSHAELLGAEALAFSERDKPAEQKQSYFAPDALSDETWMLATPAIKERYISNRRAADPAGGRALVEAVWAAENADNRVRLLNALRTGLSADDAPFLTTMLKDRAPRIRETVPRLLARLPGFEGDNPALRAALERIKVGKSGLLIKRTALSLQLPATAVPQGPAWWASQLLGDLTLDELSHALSMSVGDMIAAADRDANLMLGFLVMATHDKRFDVVETIATRHLGNAWEAIVQARLEDLGDLMPSERARWVELVVRPRDWAADMSLWGIGKLYELIERPAPQAVMRDMLNCKPWQALLKAPDRLTSDHIEGLAVLCPASTRPLLRGQIGALDPGRAANAILFLDIMDSLEATHA